MKHLYILLLFPFLFVANDIQGQNTYGHADNIVMGEYRYHISFQGNNPVVQHKINHHKNVFRYAVYSDRDGNLMVYSDGDTIWNGNHQLLGVLNHSLHDKNTMIPMPGNPDLVYLFEYHFYENGTISTNYDTLYYSLVDLNGNNGQGSIIVNHQQFSNEKLDSDIAITKHANGRDYWLVARKHLSNEYVSFHIKPGGVVDTVHSMVGISYNVSSGKQPESMIFSPNGKWFVDNTLNEDTMYLFNFNAKTGSVSDSNMIFIPPAGYMLHPWRLTFSSDNSKLYVSQIDVYPRLYQYDITSGNQQAVLNSKIMIHNSQYAQSTNEGEMALMTNGKIYSYDRAISAPGYYNPYPYFNEIVNPNNAGLACNWQPHIMLIDSSGNIWSHFPNFCSSWLQQPVDFSYTHTCAGENAQPTLFAFTDSVYQAEWHFGDSLAGGADTSSSLYPSYSYSQPGQYTVWVKALHYGMWDSIAKTIVIHQNPQIDIGIDTTLTGYDTLVLDPGGGYASYLWNTGDTTQTLTLYGSQMSGGSHNYWVEVTDTNGCSAKAYRTITYSGVGINEHKQQAWKVFPNPANEQLTIELPKALQEEAVLKLYNQSGAIVRRYEWPGQAQKLQVSLSGLSNGIYWLELDTEQRKYRQKVVKR